jgi:hypothetical protein
MVVVTTKFVSGLDKDPCYPKVEKELKELHLVSGRYTKDISNEGKLRARF